MQPIEQETEAGLFEVILYFEDSAWSFSTFARASLMREALERAEREFCVHSLHHRLGNAGSKVASAFVFRAPEDRPFAKPDAKAELSQCMAGKRPS
jgi:hypothetical protein